MSSDEDEIDPPRSPRDSRSPGGYVKQPKACECCGVETVGDKPYCVEHVRHMPRALSIAETLAMRERIVHHTAKALSRLAREEWHRVSLAPFLVQEVKGSRIHNTNTRKIVEDTGLPEVVVLAALAILGDGP